MYLCSDDHPHPHVRFASNTQLDPEPIHVSLNTDAILEAHIGMLRNHHTYRVEIPRTHTLGSQITAHHPQPNIYVRVLDVSETQTGADGQFTNVVTCQVRTIKDGNISETIILTSEEDEAKSETILVTAKILHTNQGNPMLKTGVHVLSHEHTEESDFTEWPGHGNHSED